jgi:UDP-glucose 6-dehydrogenase
VSVEPNINSRADVCDDLAVVTEWENFNNIPYQEIRALIKEKVIVDGRNSLDGIFLSPSNF